MMQNLPTQLEDRLSALRECPYFHNLDAQILVLLAAEMRLARFERGEILFWQDEECPGLHIIRSGQVKLYKISPAGREFIIRIIQDGATFNEVPVFDHGHNALNAAAVETSDIWIVSAQPIRRLMESHHAVCQSINYNLCQNLRMLVGMVEELSFYQVTHRLARLISQLPAEQLTGPASIRITQDQLAARLGTVREVVSRSLHELERSGAIRLYHRQIFIADPAILEDLVKGSN
ncbi:MAG: Crp/Fnr family transcriptional regulator [Anaerolineales bacterium]|nr:Crp/Fnr family transcriptional regulator [Anaerolineales bacterium]